MMELPKETLAEQVLVPWCDILMDLWYQNSSFLFPQ
jgi:hypothetical protein